MSKIITLLMLLMLIPSVFGLSIAPEPYYPSNSNQYYTVTFDGEGQAQVSAKIHVLNNGKESLSQIEIEIPGESVRIISALQEANTLQKRCIEYENICTVIEEPYCEDYDGWGNCVQFDYRYRPCKQVPTCVSWEEYYGYPLSYYKVEPDQQRLSHSVLLTIPLEVEILPQESATILLTYKATGYAQESLGVWSFNFQTAKVPIDSEFVRVSIATTPEFVLKGGEAEVDYLPDLAFSSTIFMSQEMTDFSSRIEYHSGFVKQTSGLDPWESFHVQGEYAKSKPWLYKGRIVFGLGVLGLLVVGSVAGLRRIRFKKFKANTAMLVSSTSFVSALLLIGVWLLGMWFVGNLYRLLPYDFEPLALLLVLALVVLGGALLFGPPVFLGLKKGFLSGLLTFVATVLWIIVLAVVVIVFFSVIQHPMIYY